MLENIPEHIYCRDYATCPYCGTEHKYGEDMRYGLVDEGEEATIDCNECDKSFFVTLVVSVSYTSYLDCEISKEKHKWTADPKKGQDTALGQAGIVVGTVYARCIKCGVTKFLKSEELKK